MLSLSRGPRMTRVTLLGSVTKNIVIMYRLGATHKIIAAYYK